VIERKARDKCESESRLDEEDEEEKALNQKMRKEEK